MFHVEQDNEYIKTTTNKQKYRYLQVPVCSLTQHSNWLLSSKIIEFNYLNIKWLG